MTEIALRVLMVAAMPFPTRHGSQVHVATQAAALAAAGHEVTLAVYGAGDGADPPGVQVIRTPYRARTRATSGPQWGKLQEDPALWRLIRGRTADVVHAHHIEATMIARAAVRAPLVYEAHTSLGEELPDLFPAAPRMMRWLGRGIDAGIPRIADATVALSELGASTLRAAGARRVTVIPPPLDPRPLAGASPDAFRRAWDLGDRPWVAYAGSLDAYQRWPLVVDAVARLSDVGLLLLFSGDPTSARVVAARLPAARTRVINASFADSLDGLAAATVAVVPRERCAGFPIKLLNQLALGVPSVVARGAVDPTPGTVSFTPGDPEDLAAVLADLVRDPARRAALAAAGRATVAEVHAPARVAASMTALYRRLILARHVARRPASQQP